MDFLSEHKDMKILSFNGLLGAHLNGLLPDGSLQLWTHLDQSDAMFMVLFKKVS
jgi:16S rRNA (cytosine967-C5)-methyltransferase